MLSTRTQHHSVWRWIGKQARALIVIYVLLVCCWLTLRFVAPDRWWWLFFFLSSFAVYLFLPAPLALLVALVAGDRWRAGLVLLVVLIGAVLYGQLLIPGRPAVSDSAQHLTVMTYNMLGFNPSPDAVVGTIRGSNADVITIQELSPPAAVAIREELSGEYPYQILDPQPGVTGLGIISRFPMDRTGEQLPGTWVGQPQVLRLDFAGVPVTILHAHPFATGIEAPAQIEQTIRERERQVQSLVAFIKAHPGPLLMPMDFNAGDQSRAYQMVRTVMFDAWREVGLGLGHTFPGGNTPGNSRSRIFGLLVPEWLVRIDYVFYSPEWQADGAWIGPWDGFSDHRPVVARLSLRQMHEQAAAGSALRTLPFALLR